MSTEETAAFAWVAEHMPDEHRKALDKFTAMNLNQRGIEWWDAMDILRDSDAHLDIVEPLAERLTDEWDVLHTYVTLTLLYSSMAFAVRYTHEMRAAAVKATIDNNGRPDDSLVSP